ncbi:ABC transporter ATP-binding protein [Desulfomicrobium orale]|uniref:ABC transporter ATP-binding protein n=1 Tax=Desulfomicrobium orale DSM 12838 TaxID=888061 RepID=A0A0X8JRY7_9BACT|nr:oligopeptide/dipeptide ABC transporter ATP-binding protein [Desulfomicrobium orale]AMD93746.1 ABC transporter ATP-binding protein [Desulfomicrobium orale DSM 12838]
MTTEALVRIANLVKHFDISGGILDRIAFSGGMPYLATTTVKAINSVSLDIHPGEILSVVGESGCGKSTLGRTVLGLYAPTGGEIFFRGRRIDNLSHADMLPYRRKMQMVFQDPYASLNPRMTVRQILQEPVRFHFPQLSASEVRDKVTEVMRQVGVDPAWAGRFPHEFSGGQRQRISIARALMVDPEFIVADEPISALDVSIQAQILNLIMDCQERFGLTYMFITHDLSVVEHISTRVAVMYLGTLCELAAKDDLYQTPQHPYSRALLSAIPKLGSKGFDHIRLKGEVPTPIHLPEGCVFHPRCPYMDERCRREVPQLLPCPNGSRAACHALEEGRI